MRPLRRQLSGWGSPRRVPGKLYPAIAAVILAGASFATASFFNTGREALFFASLGTVGCVGFMFLMARRHARPLLAPLLLLIMFGGQAAWMALLCLLQDRVIAAETTKFFDLTARPFAAMLPLLIVPACALLGMLLLKPRWSRRGIVSLITELPGDDTAETRFYVTGAALFLLLYWPAEQESATGALSYAIRTVSFALFFMPAFAGRLSVLSRPLAVVWLVCMTLNALIGVLAGSRLPFFAVVLFMAGRAFAKGGFLRLTNLAKLAAVAVPLLILSGIIGVVRQQVGRGGIELATAERMATVLDAAASLTSGSRPSGGSEIRMAGLQRMLAWSNFAVPLGTPEEIPYRGFDRIGDELAGYLGIAALDGKTREELVNEGLYSGYANNYGFMVSDKTSVEFGVLPDAWTRGGPWAVALVGLVLGMFFAAIEGVLLRLRTRRPAIALVLLMIFYSDCIGVYAMPTLVVIRRLVLDMVAYWIVMRVVSWCLRQVGVLRSDATAV